METAHVCLHQGRLHSHQCPASGNNDGNHATPFGMCSACASTKTAGRNHMAGVVAGLLVVADLLPLLCLVVADLLPLVLADMLALLCLVVAELQAWGGRILEIWNAHAHSSCVDDASSGTESPDCQHNGRCIMLLKTMQGDVHVTCVWQTFHVFQPNHGQPATPREKEDKGFPKKENWLK